jgi:DUF4097 and DUF4098 domain-containing protein YvlB
MRSRGSIVGPLILITIGVLFLARTAWPAFSVLDFISVYWPYLLIIWGGLQIIEISVRAARGAPFPSNGISAGGWFLVILISIFGFATYEIHGPESWWRRASFDQSMDWFGEAHDFPVAQQSHPAAKNPRIVIEDFRGSAKISGADTNTITLSGHKTIRAMTETEASKSDAETPVEIIDQGKAIIIRFNQQKASNKVRVTTDLDLTVPRGASLEASGQSGDFDVSGLDGDVKISSENAGVRLQDIGGNIFVDTQRGDIVRCVDVKGTVDLKGHSSDVELEKIAGQVTITGTYSGTITLRDLARPLHVDNFNTTVEVQKVNGQITMDRGSFSAQQIVGPAQLTTHATDVEIANFTDSLQITVDKGDITLRPAKAALSRLNVRTGSGNIELALPDTAKFDLTASTDRGEIENDFGAPLKLESVGRGARLLGAVGMGPALNLTTDRGTITVRKGTDSEFQESKSELRPGESEESGTTPKPPVVPKPPEPPKDLRHLKFSTIEL